jgi:hypothetical protein
MQALEGEERTVRELYAKIVSDPWHGTDITLLEGATDGRQSVDWSRDLRDLDSPKARL